MPIANSMNELFRISSVIRDMFEEGSRLKREYGEENVFDFSLGNPDVNPPKELKAVLNNLINKESVSHGYMSATGHPYVKQAVAESLNKEYNLNITSDLIIMSVGAAGAMNVALKSLLDPGDEVLTPTPCFVGYRQYVYNVGGKIKTVSTNKHFHLDFSTIEEAISEKTRVMIINSPNNPTGAVYTRDELNNLADLLCKVNKKFGKPIYLISDEPYRKIVYDVDAPSPYNIYPHTLVVTSFSKELSLANDYSPRNVLSIQFSTARPGTRLNS